MEVEGSMGKRVEREKGGGRGGGEGEGGRGKKRGKEGRGESKSGGWRMRWLWAMDGYTIQSGEMNGK